MQAKWKRRLQWREKDGFHSVEVEIDKAVLFVTRPLRLIRVRQENIGPRDRSGARYPREPVRSSVRTAATKCELAKERRG